MVEVGKKVGALKGHTGSGQTLSLSSLKGKWVVVYFYPKDSTPGCTTQAQGFRDAYDDLRERNAEVIGVSRDSAKSHANFASKQSLPFPLIADTDETWCNAFGVIAEKVLYGKRHMGVVRSTFLIDPDGKLAHEWRNIKVAGHVDAVLERIPPR